ncbi:MAG: HAD family hydrolase [Candidatus Aminicenantes bacterium]|jgi:HAD superfamily hydrolase (TIGR01549 family)
MIKVLTFDCWDTLIIDDEGRDEKMMRYLDFVCQENGISLADKDIADAWAKEDKLREEYVIANHKTKNAIQRTETLLDLLDIELPASEVGRIATYFDKVALNVKPPRVPHVDEVLKVLFYKFRLAVICNGGFHSADTVRQILDTHKLLDFFSWLSFSDEMEVAKPHRRIFEYTVEKLGCRTKDSVHIGDSEYSDIVGAKNAGMKAILFAGINPKYRNDTTADCVVDSYSELFGVLERLS